MSQDTASLEARIEELEMRVVFQEDTLQTLNRELATQQQQIEQLHLMLQTVYRELKDAQEAAQAGGQSVANERPPHY